MKHPAHIRHIAGNPTTDVLVEGVGVTEHMAHIRHAAGIPSADILVSALFAIGVTVGVGYS